MQAAERKTGYRAVGLVIERAVVFIHEIHHLVHKRRLDLSGHRTCIVGRRFLVRIFRVGTGSGRKVGVTVGHHHNHRHATLIRNHIVENLSRATHVEPRILIPSRTVEEIEHGITPLGVGAVARREIDAHAAPLHTVERRRIPHLLDRAVSHVANHIVVAYPSRNDKIIIDVVNVAHPVGIRRIVRPLLVNLEIIGIEIRRKRIGGAGPDIA